MLGEGRKEEAGAFTQSAVLNAKAAEQILAFVAAGGGSRSEVLNTLAGVVGGSAEGDEGLAELAKIDAALNSLGVGEDQAAFEPSGVSGLADLTGLLLPSVVAD